MREPVHLGPLPAATAVGAVGNPACGDVVTLYLDIREERIHDASFESMGSAYQLATASVMCDCVIGQTVAEARRRTPRCVLGKLPDLPERHRYLARLAVEALNRALDVHERQGEGHEDVRSTVRALDEDAALAFVHALLDNGRRWSTREIDAMARAEGISLPGSTLRCLTRLRRTGAIAGDLDLPRRLWMWWLPGGSGA